MHVLVYSTGIVRNELICGYVNVVHISSSFRPHTHTHTHTHSLSLTHTHTHVHAHAHTHTRTRTHTHTHTPTTHAVLLPMECICQYTIELPDDPRVFRWGTPKHHHHHQQQQLELVKQRAPATDLAVPADTGTRRGRGRTGPGRSRPEARCCRGPPTSAAPRVRGRCPRPPPPH